MSLVFSCQPAYVDSMKGIFSYQISLFLSFAFALAPRRPGGRCALLNRLLRDINSRAFISAYNQTSIVFRFQVVRVSSLIRAGIKSFRFDLPLRCPALHELRYSALLDLLFAIPGIAAAAPPTAHILESSRSRWCLSVNESAFGADQSEAILGLCLVFS